MSRSNFVLATSSRRPAILATSRTTRRGNGGSENSSGTFKGVHQRTWGKWVAEIRDPNLGFCIWLGTFSTSNQAVIAYNTAALKLYGPSAELNLPGNFREEEENQPKDNHQIVMPLGRNVNNKWYWDGDFDDSDE